MTLRCTMLATDEALTLARQEVESVAAAPCLQVAPVLGELSNERIHRAFGKSEVFWYAGHMGPQGIPLADGTLLPPAVIGAYVAAFECRLAVLNSCAGAESAVAIHGQAKRCMVIYYQEEVESATAYHCGSLVAQQLCVGGIEAAINFAREAGYKVLQAGMSYQYPGGPSPDLLQLLYELRERLVRVEVTITGVQADIERMRREQPNGLSSRQMVTTAFAVFLALLALATVIGLAAGRWGG